MEQEEIVEVGFWGKLWPEWSTGYTEMTRNLQEQGAMGWFFGNLLEAPYNILYAVSHPGDWLAWLPYINKAMNDQEVKTSLARFAYYGASVELFFALFFIVTCFTIFAMFKRNVMWGAVRILEGIANKVGRFFCWAGFIMVTIQIVIVFLQRVFAVTQISLGFGMSITYDISWWAEGLKLWNAMIVALCVTYTFVQGGHVRVDLVYAAVKHRTQRVIDMLGSLLFMLPMAVLIYLYSWFFMWRSLVVPPLAPQQTYVQIVEQKARALRWNIETIGFSPNGFDAYWLFKVLLLAFCVLVMLQAIGFFYRSFLEFVEGEESAGKYLDKDSLGEGQEAYEGTH